MKFMKSTEVSFSYSEHPFSLGDLHWSSDFIYLKDAEVNNDIGTTY
jgi:hypothetical protein